MKLLLVTLSLCLNLGIASASGEIISENLNAAPNEELQHLLISAQDKVEEIKFDCYNSCVRWYAQNRPLVKDRQIKCYYDCSL